VGIEFAQRLHGARREDDLEHIWLHHSQISGTLPPRAAWLCIND
jgi:hypothetical protein